MSLADLNIPALRKVQAKVNRLAATEYNQTKDIWNQAVWTEPTQYYGVTPSDTVLSLLGELPESNVYTLDPREHRHLVDVVVKECGSKCCIAGWLALDNGCLPVVTLRKTGGDVLDVDYNALYDTAGEYVSAAQAACAVLGVNSYDLYARDEDGDIILNLPSGLSAGERSLFDGDLDLEDVNFIIDNVVERAEQEKAWVSANA